MRKAYGPSFFGFCNFRRYRATHLLNVLRNPTLVTTRPIPPSGDGTDEGVLTISGVASGIAQASNPHRQLGESCNAAVTPHQQRK